MFVSVFHFHHRDRIWTIDLFRYHNHQEVLHHIGLGSLVPESVERATVAGYDFGLRRIDGR